MKTKILTVIMAVILIAGCKKDVADVDFSIKQKVSTSKALTGTFTYSKALIGVSNIDFEIETGDEDTDYAYSGAFQFDILNETVTPSIDKVEVDPGIYHELEINIDNVLPVSKSIEINGTYNDGTTYTFEFSSATEEDYDIQNTTGLDAQAGKTANFILQIDLDLLFNGVDFSAATTDNDNIIRINSASNSDILETIENNLENVLEFDED